MNPRSVAPGIVGVVGSLLGAIAAAVSTHDYAQNLDRKLHGAHCSFIPGAGEATTDNACTAAMQSPYSALLKDRYWGGIPISLFGLGAFAFTFAVALYLILARESAPQRTRLAYFLLTLAPFGASIVMFVISATKLGQFCKVCVAMYTASVILFVSGVLALVSSRRPFAAVPPLTPPPKPPRNADPSAPADKTEVDSEPWHQKAEKKAPTEKTVHVMPVGSWAAPIGLLAAMGTATALPAAVYAASLPSYDDRILACGKLEKPAAPEGVFVKIRTDHPKQPAITIEDPLCPSCKAFHERMVAEGTYENLDVSLVVFPLDDACNWNLRAPTHPGACVLAKAILCADKTGGSAREVLEWSYKNQEDLAAAGKAGAPTLRAKVKARFPSVDACIDTPEVDKRIEEILRWAQSNKLRLSTPQMFLGDTRVCPEDTDIGLAYAVQRISGQVKR